MSSSKQGDATGNTTTTQIANYGTMETTGPSSSRNTSMDSNQIEISAQQPSDHASFQTPPKPAVRQRIQKLQKQLQEATATSKTNISIGDGLSTSYLSSGKQNYKSIAEFSSGKPTMENSEAPPKQSINADFKEHQQVEDREENHKSANTMKSIGLPLPSDLVPLDEQRPYPKKVFFIIANEFCERFSYYGLRAILVLYFKSVLGFSDSSSTVSFHLFATLCYLTPVLGAILGDSVWGKFRTILYLSIIYLFGEIILVISAVFWDLNELSVTMTFLGLILIGIGTGGIKPCVGALGGDQFLPHETIRRESFFSIFYGAINLGALISQFLTPVLRSQHRCVNRSDCYPFAFGVPCILMFVSIIFFLLAAKHYVLVPIPSENVIVAFCKCSWIAFRRKLAGHKLPKQEQQNHIGHVNYSMSPSDDTSSSSLSSINNHDENSPIKGRLESTTIANNNNNNNKQLQPYTTPDITCQAVAKKDHWLYLADDKFDSKSIEGFRSVWHFILIFLPAPVYWCLFDQQSSLWTLQATRMDGRLFGSDIIIEPDQMSVANPVLLLASIPVFQFMVYPCLGKCNIMTTTVQRMAVGGLLAALTFVVSGMIEHQIQINLPNETPAPGYADLLLVNGLSGCAIVSPTVSYVQIPDLTASLLAANQTKLNISAIDHSMLLQAATDIGRLEPLSSNRMDLISADYQNNLNNYKFTFRLSDGLEKLVNEPNTRSTNDSSTISKNNSLPPVFNGCPYDSSKENEFIIGPLSDKTVKLLYVEQGNGKLTYKLFNDSLKLPTDGTASVRLLYEFFGSFVQADKRQFTLVRLSNSELENSKPHPELQFKFNERQGQVLMSGYIDVTVPIRGGLFELRTNDSLLNGSGEKLIIELKPGTRNLLLVHQLDAKNVQVKQNILQGNEYRISILYQLIPYLMISISEIMFSISGMELAYSMAPDTMKSIVMSFGSLNVAFGNILTVAVESAHLFTNVVHDFIFYACLMALDMVVFAYIAYYYAPHPQGSSRSTRDKDGVGNGGADSRRSK